MKKILFICLTVMIAFSAAAQWINIPDVNFRNWLNANGYASCMNGTMLNASCPAVLNASSVNCGGANISDLTGIGAFVNLGDLNCSGNQLSSLPSLPQSLLYLECNSNALMNLPSLPPNLVSLWCQGNLLTGLPALPNSLNILYVHYNQLTSLPALPSNLQELACHENLFNTLDGLPGSLSFIVCGGSHLTNITYLPSSLHELQIAFSQITSVPDLPASLVNMVCAHNLQLTSLPPLTNGSLEWLDVNDNNLNYIPDLPDSMVYVDISSNPLTCLPKYKRINYLQWSNTGITCLQNSGTIGTASPPVNTLPACTPPAASITPAGPLTFCSGGSVTLNANTGTGFTYKWIKNGSVIAGATNQSYAAAASGNYAVEVTKNCGFAVSSAALVTLKSLPSAVITPAGATTFCSGGSVVLNALVQANRTYQWKKNNINISGATSSSYTATTSGNFKVTVTNTITGCTKTTVAATVITVNSLPSATITPQGPTTFCAGGSVVLKANAGTGLTYKWKKNGAFISGATLINYTATTAGTYRVLVTNSNGCSKISAAQVVTVNCRWSDESAEGARLSVFPNPADGVVKVRFSSEENQMCKLIVTDVTGRELIRELFSASTGINEITFDLSSFGKGAYFVKLKTPGSEMLNRIVKE